MQKKSDKVFGTNLQKTLNNVTLTQYQFISIFDLDHTLLRANISVEYGKFMYRHRILPRLALAYAIVVYFCHKWFGLSLHSLHQIIFRRCFKGIQLEILEESVTNFLDQYFEKYISNPVLNHLQKALSNGHYTVLLSNSPDFIVSAIAKRMGFHEWSATKYFFNNTGILEKITDIVDGHFKASYAQELMKQLRICNSKVSAYSDSVLDLPLLQVVGKKFVVNPNSKLKKIAIKNNWSVIQH